MDMERIANLDQLAALRQSVVQGPNGKSWRAIDVSVYGGLTLRVLPDRGFDISHASWQGIPLVWIGPTGEGPALSVLNGQDWEAAFSGGLLATCGLANVGEASEGHAQHGRINHMPAQDIVFDRTVVDGKIEVQLSATVIERTLDDGLFRMERCYRFLSGSPAMAVVDTVTNLSTSRKPAPLLYHINLGWPLVDGQTRIEVAGRQQTLTEFGDQGNLPGGWSQPGKLSKPGKPSVTMEHVLDPALVEGQVRILSPGAGVAMTIRWDRKSLPRLFQWVNFQPGIGVLAIEPSNACTLGREFDRQQGRLAFLNAGESRTTMLQISLERL
jgi:hypothetical protein